LEDKVDAGARIDPECKDSIGATRAVVNKMKTQNVALVDKRTGEIIKSSTEKLITAPLYFSASLFALFVVAVLLYAFWMRDDETHFFKSIQKTLREIRIKIIGGKREGKSAPSTELKKSGYSL
jgi:DNA replication initiation complex subunit (GINS family)